MVRDIIKNKTIKMQFSMRDYIKIFTARALSQKVCQTSISYWDDDVVISSVRIFHRDPSFKEKPLMLMIWIYITAKGKKPYEEYTLTL